MAVTMTQIARRTRLSPATVSRVLNNKADKFISAATRERVVQAAKELGYQPNRLARGLVTGRTQVVALWIRNPDRPYYAGILRTVQELTADSDYQMILHGYRDVGAAATPHENGSIAMDGFWPVDGVIAADCPHMLRDFLAANPEKPVVGISSDCLAQSDYVAFDLASGVRQAARHLVDVGCKRIAHLTGGCSIKSVREIREGEYATVVRAAGQSPEVIHAENESRAAARRAVVEHVQQHGHPDGLFCLNDDMAIGAYRGLRDLGLRVPQDVSIVGYDGIEDVEYLDVPLTTILQPVEEMCRRAWEILLQRLQGESLPLTQELIQPRLIVRESTRR